ncbi:MAG: hypothetical protein HGB10_01370 [Coriobacteriia bacterium]|nr:hypothetical protein [Coriobacteriia bacterium]
MRKRAEYLSGGKLRAIEMYLLGKQHAAGESDAPFDPMSDPFIGGTA